MYKGKCKAFVTTQLEIFYLVAIQVTLSLVADNLFQPFGSSIFAADRHNTHVTRIKIMNVYGMTDE